MIDLHTHSTASDGSLTPAELVSAAVETGITWLALTDHNTAAGLPEFLSAAERAPLRPVAGMELTCDFEGEELHILALDLPRRSFGPMNELTAQLLRQKEESNRDLIANLRRDGYLLDYDAIAAANPGSVINRAHIGRALTEAGYTASVREAFVTLLDESAGYYHPAGRLDSLTALGIIRDAGALSVWAHPLFKMTAVRVNEVLTALVPGGLVGMENYYPTYTPEQTADAFALADAFGLKHSGGSDFHGKSKPDTRLGVGKGGLHIPESVAEALFG